VNNFRTEQDYRKALVHFQQAINLDSSYAPAYAGLAQYYIWGSDRGFISPQDAYRSAKLAIMHALQLDETLAEAHAALSNIKMFFDWDWHEAEQRLKRAIELNASSSDAHFSYMMLLETNRRFDEAIAEINHIQEIDPLNIRFRRLALGWLNLYARHHDASISQCKKVLELDSKTNQAANLDRQN
jgi:tetratricopeptide (TPR) repeat protein